MRLPLVPVTVTVNVPFVVDVIVNLAVPEPVRLAGLIVAINPLDGVTERATVLSKWFTVVTFTITVDGVPA